MKVTRLTFAAGLTALSLSPVTAFAASGTFGSVMDTFRTDTASASANLLGALAFVAGLGCIVFAIMKMVAHHRNPQDPTNKTSSALVTAIAGFFLIAVPTVAGVGVASFFGSGADTSSISGSLQSIN